ncbi:hypothetical protein BJV78DRAFT_1296627 [Lactifluus subvellereus]|nr:hypothetical protein BJV78DRAFT_1296627 [Lactifluus subvellereus]
MMGAIEVEPREIGTWSIVGVVSWSVFQKKKIWRGLAAVLPGNVCRFSVSLGIHRLLGLVFRQRTKDFALLTMDSGVMPLMFEYHTMGMEEAPDAAPLTEESGTATLRDSGETRNVSAQEDGNEVQASHVPGCPDGSRSELLEVNRSRGRFGRVGGLDAVLCQAYLPSLKNIELPTFNVGSGGSGGDFRVSSFYALCLGPSARNAICKPVNRQP